MSLPVADPDAQANQSVTVRAPGKINASFTCGGPGPDGYHPVATLYVAVSLNEEVTASARADGEVTAELAPASSVVTDPAAFPIGRDNLAVAAAHSLREATGVDHGVDLSILKRVPVAGGMGGGSADAAAALVACNALWGTHLARNELARIGARLGADVPFALYGGAAVGLGRGEQLAPVPLREVSHWVLVPASYGLSTPAVYQELDRQRKWAEAAVTTPQEVPAAVLHAVLEGDAHALARSMTNDLQPASIALAPELAEAIAAAEGAGALKAMVSGSGPTLACVAETEDHARRIALQLRDELDVHAVAVTAPAPGAEILSVR